MTDARPNDLEVLEETIESLYLPGHFAEGEQLCIEVLEMFEEESPVALMYLALNLAGMDQLAEALESADALPDECLIPCLQQLPFGRGNESETELYKRLSEIARERGLEEELEEYFNTRDRPWPNAESPLPKPIPQPEGKALDTSFLLDLRRLDPRWSPVVSDPEPVHTEHVREFRQSEEEEEWTWVLVDADEEVGEDEEWEWVDVVENSIEDRYDPGG
ncbi:MAG: hypothetical protein AB7S38_38155 [Vulcanimicrobiota bacterium]